ncbi:hypothetical protein LGL55_14010 [Clostridium tagluense]|uniref:hypothetical protein n=1 Tax=Clostridium tagluense TaxID=360422 RepID=UPI001C0AB409|nr:hypothetical protein [Clostridium tagluense]MBU3129304.1 hypothetical protein [Clostridium tagluense]MCB2312353.1 hypothetical protein [Clostridium tagluense]MCB2317028.1 hypothetical protein [Clostridium tagluense]MCB2321945.1 hypothetical protein [Clostridium tagluense]MCB2326860.1 hypothetical protein [Clostridium tagluense]
MKTSKKILLVLSLIVLVLSFAACKKKVAIKPVPEKAPNVASKKTEDTTNPASGTISDDLYKYEVLVNGIAYSLPTSFSTFEKNKWVGADFDKSTLNPNQYKIEYPKNGEQTLMIHIANFGTDVSPISKCHVGGITINSDNKKNGTTIYIAKKITIGSTYDQVIAAYGKPSNEYKGDTLTKLTYKSGTYSNYEISFDTKNKKVSSIKIENLVSPAKAETTSVDTKLPAVVKNYKVPSSVGTDLLSFQVKYGGTFYKLPVPITELIKNGWVLQSDSAKVLAAKSSTVGIELRKNNQVLRTQIKNYSDKGEPIKYCFATYIEYYNNGAMIPLELPKGISEKSTIEQVIAAYGKPTKVDNSPSFKYYSYGKIFQEVVFMTKNGKIEKIEVTYAPKNLN